MLQWMDADQTMIRRGSDGAVIPADPTNADYAALLEAGASISPFQRFATLEEAKLGRLDELAHRRWVAEQNFSFGGSPLTLDDGTQRRIGGAIQYLELSAEPSVRWQVTRGVFATFSLAQIKALGVAAGAHVQACFANVETRAGEIEAAETIEEVEAVNLNQGWP